MSKIVGFLSALLLGATSVGAVSITECGQLVPRGEVGVLAGDLSCVGGPGVRLEPRATLDLAGFTIEMSHTPGPIVIAVQCADSGGEGFIANCNITSSSSPGTLRGGGTASRGIFAKNVRIQNVAIEDFWKHGIQARKVKAQSVTVSGNAMGINADVVQAVDLTLDGNATGVFAGRVLVSQASASGNIEAIVAIKGMRGDGVTISGSTNGLRIYRTLRLRSSTIVGNAIDLLTAKRPRITDVTCAVSKRLGGNEPPVESWGVCSDD